MALDYWAMVYFEVSVAVRRGVGAGWPFGTPSCLKCGRQKSGRTVVVCFGARTGGIGWSGCWDGADRFRCCPQNWQNVWGRPRGRCRGRPSFPGYDCSFVARQKKNLRVILRFFLFRHMFCMLGTDIRVTRFSSPCGYLVWRKLRFLDKKKYLIMNNSHIWDGSSRLNYSPVQTQKCEENPWNYSAVIGNDEVTQ